jgi:hypothetical protein
VRSRARILTIYTGCTWGWQVKERAAKSWSTVVEVSGKAGSQVAQQSAQLSERAMENQVRRALSVFDLPWVGELGGV